MTWTLCSSEAAIAKAGANVNTTVVASNSIMTGFIEEAESIACDLARHDVVTNFGGLTANGKQLFANLCSSLIGQMIIGYEPEAIGTGGATLRLNVLENNISRAARMLKDDKYKTYLGIT